LVNLLFQVKNNDFGEEITSKPYSKYVYKIAKTGPKTTEKEAFLKAIDGDSFDHLYGLNPLKKKWVLLFLSQKTVLKDSKRPKSTDFLFDRIFLLNEESLIEVQKKEESKRRRYRSKRTKWWCFDCQKFVYKDYWSLYH
jgi:hypothetical protein